MDNYTEYIKSLANQFTKRFAFQCYNEHYGCNQLNEKISVSCSLELLSTGFFKLNYFEYSGNSNVFSCEIEIFGYIELKNNEVLLKSENTPTSISSTQTIGICEFKDDSNKIILELNVRNYLLCNKNKLNLFKTEFDFTFINGDKILLPKFIQQRS